MVHFALYVEDGRTTPEAQDCRLYVQRENCLRNVGAPNLRLGLILPGRRNGPVPNPSG